MGRIKSKPAFSLMELLLAASLSAVVGLVILSMFSAGLKAYGRVRGYSGPQAEVLLSLAKMEKDLRNAFPWTGIGFKGDSSRLSFAGLVRPAGDDAVGFVLGRISYSFNAQAGALLREEKPYPQALEQPAGGPASPAGGQVLASIKSIGFSYYYFNMDTKKYDWKDLWDQDKENGIPRGVKIKIVFRGEHEDIELHRAVFLPAAG
ncbi:MAG: hypothetical protein HY209_04075 [Candidatus Omnitrophica bacterium]|nr:hypothetical protein [Candidatus Omnitrophota bacterium]